MIFDSEVPIEQRIEACITHEDVGDIISRLCSMYVITSLDDFAIMIHTLSCYQRLNIIMRLECIKTLAENKNKYSDFSSKAYDSLNNICKDFNPATTFIEKCMCITYLFRSNKHRFLTKKYLRNLVSDNSYTCKQRYKYIISIKDLSYLSEKVRNYYICESNELVVFTWAEMMYRLMASQVLIKHLSKHTGKRYSKLFIRVRDFVIDQANNSTDYNTRADAADILLNSGIDELQLIGQTIILSLSGGTDYYNNNQNVHMKSIEKSCLQNIEMLVKCVPSFREYESCVPEFLKEVELTPALTMSLDRVSMDLKTYTKYNLRLSTLFCLVWTYVNKHAERKTLIDRLEQELIEGSGLCSSGFMARIINTLSGFDDFLVGIDYCDQVIAYFKNTVNTLVINHPLQEEILSELSDGSGDNLKQFLRQNLSMLRQNCFIEFKDYMDDTDFDLYFKRAYESYFI